MLDCILLARVSFLDLSKQRRILGILGRYGGFIQDFMKKALAFVEGSVIPTRFSTRELAIKWLLVYEML